MRLPLPAPRPGFDPLPDLLAIAFPEDDLPPAPPADPSSLSPFERLEATGYLLVESTVVGGRVLWIADPSRVPASLRGLPSFSWPEVEKLLALPREAARQAIRDLLKVKATFGPRSRLEALHEDHGDPEGAPAPEALPTPSPDAGKPSSPATAPPRTTADLFREARS